MEQTAADPANPGKQAPAEVLVRRRLREPGARQVFSLRALAGRSSLNVALLGALALCLAIGLVGWTTPAVAQTPTPGEPTFIYLFWGDGCPHCAKAKPYLESLPSKFPGVILKSFEVYYNEENQKLFSTMAEEFGIEQLAVPTIFIGPYYMQGYSEELNEDIETTVMHCLLNGCIDPGEGRGGSPAEITPTSTLPIQPTPAITDASIIPVPSGPIQPATTGTPAITSTPVPATPTALPTEQPNLLNQSRSLTVPLIGSINLELQSITLSTALIAFVDGFNPCSLWVLSMLMALTLHTGSRKKVFIIGFIFLTVTAAIYALFIAGLFSALKIASFLGWVQVLVALLALFFALVNIKDYFWYKEGISFTIADREKPGIYQRMRKLLDASQSFWGLAGATIVFAAGVSLVEFSCTAGFPVLWTNLLVSQNVTALAFVLLLLLYLLIYQLDEMAIFITAVYTLRVSKLEEKHGRILKLVGGMLMLTLAIVMLVKPALMNDLSSSMLIFVAALSATLLVLTTHRILLPKIGIRIGTELERK